MPLRQAREAAGDRQPDRGAVAQVRRHVELARAGVAWQPADALPGGAVPVARAGEAQVVGEPHRGRAERDLRDDGAHGPVAVA